MIDNNKKNIMLPTDASTSVERNGTRVCGDFSLLMSVYQGDSADHLRSAVLSNTVEQQVYPAQVVIVRDGPVKADVQSFLQNMDQLLRQGFADAGVDLVPEFVYVPIKRNHGLAYALNEGLQHCRYDIVARADSDDIALPRRFSVLLPRLKNCAVIGSAIQEFSGNEQDSYKLGSIRKLPTGGEELSRYARLQSPLNHPSVVFRKSIVQAVGGYPEDVGRFEDYLLWEQLLLSGAVLNNVPEVLVLYRVDAGAYARRGGWYMFRGEIALQRRFLADGFISTAQFIRNVLIRTFYRLAPTWLRQFMYRSLKSMIPISSL